jgi:hypothetical protein
MAHQLPQAIRQALDAANVGDTAAFLACFQPHLGCVIDWGRQYHGNRNIRRWTEQELVGKRASLKVIHFYVAGGDTTVIAELKRTDFHGPATLLFRLKDDHIATMDITA